MESLKLITQPNQSQWKSSAAKLIKGKTKEAKIKY